MSTAVVRGLTTVALLKVNYDANADHLDFYMPFVLDTLRAWSDDAFLAEDASAEIYGRHSLRLPVEAVRTLLTRVCKLGYLRREHGRFFRNPHKPVEDDFSSQRAAIEREHAAVAKRFVDFAQNHNLRIASEEEALAIILSFLESNDVAILLGSGVERISAAEEHESARELRTAARFIQEILTADPSLAEYIQRMLEGLVLQNALLLRNINLRRRQFKDLEVFFDTGFLFRAVGLSSGPYVAAAREALDMLRKAGARLAVFSNTIDEMRSVLAAIERRIGTSSGIQTLRSTELVRFFVSRRYQPSDVAKASALLERNIRQAGFTVRALPTRIPLYTLDEEDLARRLMREDQTDIDPRVDHDVNVVAAVLTLRRGRIRQSIDDTRVIFSSPTSIVVRKVTEWYRGQRMDGAPPIIHQTGLSNIAWLKNPGGAATQLKRSELVALCAAALRPTPTMWRRFTEELRKLKDSGELTSEEEIAVLTSQLVDARLAEVEDEEDVDAETVVDIIQRVRDSYAEEAARSTGEAVDAKARELAGAVETAMASAREHAELGRVATERAAKSEEERRQLELRINHNTDALASWAANICYWGLGIIVALGTLVSLTGLSVTSAYWARILAVAVLAMFLLLSFVDLYAGLSVKHLRAKLERYIARRLAKWWLGYS